MTPIVSPTTTERILRTLGLLALFSVFSGWFLFDGYFGYPEQNVKKAIESLQPVPEELPPIHQGVNEETVAGWVGDFSADRRLRTALVERFGEPGWENPERNTMCYFGPGGMLTIKTSGEVVLSGLYEPGDKPDSELMWQKVLGTILMPVAIAMLLQLIRVIATKVELSESGLKVRGRPVIPFDAMTEFEATKYRKKGFMDLVYTLNGRQRRVRLDDYVIRDFRPIIEQVCQRTGIPNPLPPPKNQPAPTGEQSE